MNLKVIKDGAAHLFVKRCLSPFWYRRRWLQKTQWLSKERLTRIQLRLLRKIVEHSYYKVPFYGELMDDLGIKPDDITHLEDIDVFPILKKSDVLKSQESFVPRNYAHPFLRKARTGGSTGKPVMIYRNWFSIGNEHAFVRRQFDWAGVRLSDRSAYLSGRVLGNGSSTSKWAYDPFMKELIFSTYQLTHKTAADYLQVMQEYKVKAIVGYPSAIYFLAKCALDFGSEVKLKACLTTSETITKSMRMVIAEAFSCNVFDFYGAAERVCYIHACEKGSYHIIPEYGLTELLPVEGFGENAYKVIATGFWNHAMPLIRYDTGDVVIKKPSEEKCSCGRAFTTVDSIVGREGDKVVTPSGQTFGVTILIHLLYVVCGGKDIAETQFVQDEPDHLTVRYVPGNDFSPSNFREVQQKFKSHLPEDIRIDFVRFEAVPRTESGKLKRVVSYLNEE